MTPTNWSEVTGIRNEGAAKAYIVGLYNNGNSLERIAQVLLKGSVTNTNVKTLLKSMGIKLRDRGGPNNTKKRRLNDTSS